jgi:hypothetical protein
LATIATHDLALLPAGPLHYLARPPKRIKLVPLAQDKQISATELFQKLQAEAKEEKKEQSTSGIFRFLFSLSFVHPEFFTHLIVSQVPHSARGQAGVPFRQDLSRGHHFSASNHQ